MPPPHKAVIERTRNLYFSHIKRYLTHLSPKQYEQAIAEIQSANGIHAMKQIYNYYKDIEITHTQSLTSLQSNETQDDLLEDLVPTIQSFVKSKLSEKKAVAKQMKKPEHRIVKPTPSQRLDLAILSWTEYKNNENKNT